jgi:hypothetical protein
MEPVGSLPCLQGPASGPYSEPDESSLIIVTGLQITQSLSLKRGTNITQYVLNAESLHVSK